MNQDQEFRALKEFFGLSKKSKRIQKLEKSGMKDKNKMVKKEKSELLIPKVLRTEFNFLKYPFFDLSTTSKRDVLEIRENVKSDEGKADIFWEVSCSYYYEVFENGDILIPKSYFYSASDSVKFRFLKSSESQLIAVTEDSEPLTLLICHDFSTGESWPHKEMDENYSDALTRGQKLFEKFCIENPEYRDSQLNLY